MDRQNYVVDNLERAINEKWIKVFYQPIIRTTNGKVCAEEALSRWDDPEYGLMSPAEFVPALENAGLIWKLDLFVVEQVLEKIRLQAEKGMINVPQSVNLSCQDFGSCDIVEEIRRRVDDSGVSRKLLKVELTESRIDKDLKYMKSCIDRFRELGFSVWLDNFGSGYSMLSLLQTIKFDLVKFNVRSMKSFEAGKAGRVILTEMMKIAIALDIDSICEGVESEEEAQFLREIGCEKLQGFYYHSPAPAEVILKRFEEGKHIGAEDPEETAYFDTIGRLSLYDLSIVNSNDPDFQEHYFDNFPMAVLETAGDEVQFVRTNQAYRKFVDRTVRRDILEKNRKFSAGDRQYRSSFLRMVLQSARGKSSFFMSEKLPDGATVHAYIRWLADNPVSKTAAVAVVILAVADAEQDASYENIARALAADYFKLYYVDLETDSFIEYSSDAEQEELAIERHGEDFFGTARADAARLLYEDDLENFLFAFTKENVLTALKEQGTFTLTYRQMRHGEPVHVNMKAMRMQSDGYKIIIGINRIDVQAKLKEGYERSVLSSAIGETEAARLASVSLNTVSFAVKSCIRLMKTGEFRDNVEAVLLDIMKAAQAASVRIILINKEKEEISIFSEVSREGLFPDRKQQIEALRYEMIAGWENLIDDDNAIIIETEKDMELLNERLPEWVETMRRDGCTSLVLVPLHRSDRILGYLYVLNYNRAKTRMIKELIELVSFFLSSEIESYLFKKELEKLSNYDDLTGLKNRHSMIRRVRALEAGEECSFGIITMDLNGLKHMNDTEGHFAGDAMILDAVELLRREFGSEELYRIGGDEFIVIFPGISEDAFEKRVEEFRPVLKESGVSLAIGPWWSETNEDADGAFYHADLRMYADKKAFYDSHPEMKKSSRN